MVLPKYLLIRKIISEIRVPLIAIITLVAGATYGFSVYEGWTILESFYFLIVTITTIGYGDFIASTNEGRVLAIGVIILGIGIISLSINAIGNRVIRYSLNHDVRYEEAIATYQNHVVIAGYSDIGKRIAQYLSVWGIPLVVIDTEYSNVQMARDDNFMAIQGDISNPRELAKLNLGYARGLILAIRDPNVTLISAQAARLLEPDLWVVSEAEVGVSKGSYKRAGLSAAIDRFSSTKVKIRGILWGLEIQNMEFHMPDGISFFQIPNFQLLTASDLKELDFSILGLINNSEFYPYNDHPEKFDESDYLFVAGPAERTKDLANALRIHLPEDKDGVRRVMIVGYGKYAKTILKSAIRNADEVYVIDTNKKARREAKKDGRSKVEVRSRPTKKQLEVMDIIILTSRQAGKMIALTLQAKELNEDVQIYARAAITEHIDIFEAAGAEYVFSPEVDCASQLAGKVINFEFSTRSIPFKNGQLLFHTGDIKIKGFSKRWTLATYRPKEGHTRYFQKRAKKSNEYTLEFVGFKNKRFFFI